MTEVTVASLQRKRGGRGAKEAGATVGVGMAGGKRREGAAVLVEGALLGAPILRTEKKERERNGREGGIKTLRAGHLLQLLEQDLAYSIF